MTFPVIPSTTEEFLDFLAREYLTTESAARIGEVDANSLLANPHTWGEPHEVAAHISRLMGKGGGAHLVTDPGILLEILNGNPNGFVIAYHGKTQAGNKFGGNLIIRRSGLEWEPVLNRTRAANARLSTERLEQSRHRAHLAHEDAVRAILANIQAVTTTRLTPEQWELVAALRYDLWELDNVNRDDSLKAIVFASIHLRLLNLLKEMAVEIENLLAKAQHGDPQPQG